MRSWDFRDQDDIFISEQYEKKGFVISNADTKSLEKVSDFIISSVLSYANLRHIPSITKLGDIHQIIQSADSNELRLHILAEMAKSIDFNKYYYECSKNMIHALCGSELAMQRRIGLSINFPESREDILPIHADVWNGVSPFELNIWIPLVDCQRSMDLYILPRDRYEKALQEHRGLLQKDSEQMYEILKDSLEWIDIEYGKVLAFDQSLHHGYSLNKEAKTHFSLNCRFKNVHSPYGDKRLGEYYVPITVRSATRIGCHYKEPTSWIND